MKIEEIPGIHSISLVIDVEILVKKELQSQATKQELKKVSKLGQHQKG